MTDRKTRRDKRRQILDDLPINGLGSAGNSVMWESLNSDGAVRHLNDPKKPLPSSSSVRFKQQKMPNARLKLGTYTRRIVTDHQLRSTRYCGSLLS